MAAARYCRSCGAALGTGDHPTGAASAGSAGTGGLPDVAADLRRDAPSRWWLAAAALVVAVITGVWVLAGAGRSDTGAASPGTGPTTPVDDGTGPLGAETGAGPVLGRPVGWSLVLGDPENAGQGLWRLDLDTGQMTEFAGVTGGPLLAVGHRVVLVTINSGGGDGNGPSGTVRVVSADSPTADAVPIAEDAALIYPGRAVAAEGETGGAFWLYRGGAIEPHWHLFGLDGGDRLEAIDAGPFGAGIVPGAGPEVAGSLSGGVFRRADDGYRLVAQGRPIVARGHDVLVRSCSSPVDCSLAWVDRDSGRAVDRPVPDLDDVESWFGGVVNGSDRYFLTVRRATGSTVEQPVVVDLDTARTVDLGVGGWPLASSPDGRYLVVGDDQGSMAPAIVDVETGDRYEIPRPSMTSMAAVFVAND